MIHPVGTCKLPSAWFRRLNSVWSCPTCGKLWTLRLWLNPAAGKFWEPVREWSVVRPTDGTR